MDIEFRIIHVSDLHVGYDAETTNKSYSILKSIVKRYSGDVERTSIVISGDIWHESEKAANISKRVFDKSRLFEIFGRDRIFICPGNHDFIGKVNYSKVPKQGRFDYFFWKKYPSMESVIHKSTKYHFIGLDSCKEDNKRGKLGESQLRFVRECWGRILKEKRKSQHQRRRKLSEKAKEEKEEEEETEGEDEERVKYLPKFHKSIVYLHHHPFVVRRKNALADRDELMKILSRKCDVLLFGHHHQHRRLEEKEKEWNVPFILASGKCPSLLAYREITFFGKNIPPQVKDVKVKILSKFTNKKKSKK